VTIAEWIHRCPFCATTRNGHRRVLSAVSHYVRNVRLTNHATDNLLINQWKSKLSYNLETSPYGYEIFDWWELIQPEYLLFEIDHLQFHLPLSVHDICYLKCTNFDMQLFLQVGRKSISYKTFIRSGCFCWTF